MLVDIITNKNVLLVDNFQICETCIYLFVAINSMIMFSIKLIFPKQLFDWG